MADSTEKNRILRSFDGIEFKVKDAVAMESQTIKHIIDEGCDGVIPLPNVSSKILKRVIEYCAKHVGARTASSGAAADVDPAGSSSKSSEAELKLFDRDFVKVDQATLLQLFQAANYLNIKGLLDLTCLTIADMFKEKTTEEIRETFKIENDFTLEEEKKLREKNPWAFS